MSLLASTPHTRVVLTRPAGHVNSLHVEYVFTYSWDAATRMNTVFRLVNLVYGMDMHTFKVTVFINRAKCE